MSPTPFEAHLDVTKTLIAVAITAAIAVGGLVFAWIKRGEADNPWVPLGIGIAVFFVMATVSFKQFKTYQQGQSGPIVRIDNAGVLDRRIGQTPIPWSAIQGAEIKDISNAKLTKRGDEDERNRPQVMGVVLNVENAAQFIDSDGLLSAATKAVGTATGHSEIAISPEGLSSSAEDILSAVQSHLASNQN